MSLAVHVPMGSSNNDYRVGELLIALGKITPEILEEALGRQRESRLTLGEELIRLGAISEATLLDALSRKTQLPYMDLSTIQISIEAQKLLAQETLEKHSVLPLGIKDKALVLGMLDPTDSDALQAVEFECGKDVRPVLLSTGQFHRMMDLMDRKGYAVDALSLDAGLDVHPEMDIRSMLTALVSWGGQDLHLSADAVPAVRVDNEMRRFNLPPCSAADVERLVGDIASSEQKKAFAAGALELDFAVSVEGIGRFRCNAYHQRGAMAFTARYVNNRIPTLRELHVPEFMREYALMKQGLVLVVGPNGHGKSTTMASLIDVINSDRRANVITIEDPIEFLHHHKKSNVNQREVGTDTASFSEGLRSIFRQNPDVIVIGEMRDPESIQIALTAAETGHLVIASMHALNATAAVDRILDVFPGDQQQQVRTQLADSMQVVFSQRLVPRASGHGRALAYEKVAHSHRVSKSIREGRGHSLRQLMQSNMDELESIDRSLAALVASGEVALDEARKWADDQRYMEDLSKR